MHNYVCTTLYHTEITHQPDILHHILSNKIKFCKGFDFFLQREPTHITVRQMTPVGYRLSFRYFPPSRAFDFIIYNLL